MKQYTILYTLTRNLHLGDVVYHHSAHVTAADPIAAEALCRADALNSVSYQTLIMFEGHLTALIVGNRVLHHVFRSPS